MCSLIIGQDGSGRDGFGTKCERTRAINLVAGDHFFEYGQQNAQLCRCLLVQLRAYHWLLSFSTRAYERNDLGLQMKGYDFRVIGDGVDDSATISYLKN